MHFEFDMQRKAINLIAKNNCLDVIIWPNHLRVIKVIKFTKAKFQQNSQTGFKLKKKHYNSVSATKNAHAEKSLQYKIKWHVPRVLVLTFFRVDLSSRSVFFHFRRMNYHFALCIT